uniref:Uncharacterized protein n=1 Tax=Magnetococcus massalia (strain MO-1) TaxID=451514 RepID=A0A1S7LLS4_MAGMO|nr:protein of unknown function [Candidatus Magnetococcus massalia]
MLYNWCRSLKLRRYNMLFIVFIWYLIIIDMGHTWSRMFVAAILGLASKAVFVSLGTLGYRASSLDYWAIQAAAAVVSALVVHLVAVWLAKKRHNTSFQGPLTPTRSEQEAASRSKKEASDLARQQLQKKKAAANLYIDTYKPS